MTALLWQDQTSISACLNHNVCWPLRRTVWSVRGFATGIVKVDARILARALLWKATEALVQCKDPSVDGAVRPHALPSHNVANREKIICATLVAATTHAERLAITRRRCTIICWRSIITIWTKNVCQHHVIGCRTSGCRTLGHACPTVVDQRIV